jgi:multidrug transporter EmrE-like cation transporter
MFISVLLTISAQLFFSIGDMLKRLASAGKPFTLALLKDPTYVVGLLLPAAGFLLLLYVLTRLELSRTIPILSVSAIVLSAIFGAVFLRESLNAWNLLGLAIAILAIYLVQLR